MSSARAVAMGSATTTLLLLLSASPAFAAPAKQACVDAATRGQIQRDDLKLESAAEAFEVCAASTCPPAVRKSCGEWLAEVKASIPTVKVHVVDTTVTPTAIRIDGKDTPLDTAVSLDPGSHRVTVEAANKLPFAEDISLAPKEAKTVEVRFAVEHKPPPPMTRPTPKLVWILGGVAIVGTASWATFGLIAKSKTDSLSEECAPTCSSGARNSAFRLAAIADVSLAIGIVAAVAGAVFYFTRPSRPATSAAAAANSVAGPHIVF